MVTVREQLATPGPHFSVEFYPPRTDDEEAALWTAIRRLEAHRPAFVSVTYGAGGSRRDRTIRVTERIATQTTLLPVGHLTAVGHTVAEPRQVIGSYAAAGVHNILALRGDPPGSDPLAPWVATPGGLQHADDLVRLVRTLGSFCVGVAAYPGKHPQSADVSSDTRYLAGKVAAGAEFVITQMLFSAADYAALRDRASAAGIDVPILPGIMPVTSSSRLAKICRMSGQPVPVGLARRLDAVADDPAAGRAIGFEHALGLCRDLLEQGAPSLHFYTFNRSTVTLRILAELGLGAGRAGPGAARATQAAAAEPGAGGGDAGPPGRPSVRRAAAPSSD